MNTQIIEQHFDTLLKIRAEHKEEVMQRFNKKYPTRKDKLYAEDLLEPSINRSTARKLIMKEVDFLKYMINREGPFSASKIDEQLTDNFYVQKVIKDKDQVCVFITNDNKKCFDRGLYAVVIEKGQLSFNVLNLTQKTIRMLDHINIPVSLKPSPIDLKIKKVVKKVARKYKQRVVEED